MQILQMIFYTAVTLGVLVFIHELGHFLAAKLTGMRVDRFSIGFPPRAFGKKIGETDYCISWIPLGGYVKIAGMIDESFDTEFLERQPEPWEFRARPMWARMIVISAGVIMNILLAIAIFWGLHYSKEKFIKETTEIGYVIQGSAAEQSGLHAGDKVISINEHRVTRWDEIQSYVYLENPDNDIVFEVESNGISRHVTVQRKIFPQPSDEPFGIMESHTQSVVQGIEMGMPAEKLGLMLGDTITALDEIPVANDFQVIKIVREHTGKPLKISWKRNAQIMSGTTTVTEAGRIGIKISSVYTGPFLRVRYSLFGAFAEALNDVKQATIMFYRSVGRLFVGKASFKESFGGPIKIAQIATQSAEYGLPSYLAFMAMLSMSLAMLNILPFPALDGGHLAMLLYEKIFRREIPHNVKLTIQQAGFVVLLAFMAFVIYNDITNF